MAKLKLAFAYQGHQPGDVVDVPDEAVKDLVRAGVGHLEGAEPVLKFGRLPEVAEPVQSAPEPARRMRKAEAPETPAE
ncbi:hypothetical protein PO587_02830 [Streptomyces gilvifuscus]|uniref:Uncharacterized protein n=1 Tax=Streptomyces gilvifuscus TaxID=1550617 RepID=A0ABT5FLI4_9ACTN|nr:hypothetical protein [Streptomyces gilvifuscus]MDC2953386.1 hypothetical protein [Streptomyces gilvifuscus]